MSKQLDLNQSVYELTQQYPELVDIMKELGFTEIANPAMLHSMGRMMTIPKGAKMKKISMLDVVTALLQHGFELVGEMPTMAVAQPGVQPAATQDSTTEVLKSYLRRLGSGEDLESVRADFVKNFSSVDASEIMKAEQELMQEGTPLQEVQKLCDVHSALFHGATREEQIANAEKAVEDSLLQEKLAQHSREVRQEKQQRTAALRAIPGHPLAVFSKRNEALAALLEQLKAGMKADDLSALPMEELRHLATHYAMKGDLLYPLLKVRYEISGPSDVMWTVDDEIRHEITALTKAEVRDTAWKERLQAVLTRAEEMIYKEENILFPICAVNFTEEEWMGIYQDAKDYAAPFGIAETWPEAEEQRREAAAGAMESGEIVMPGGHMTIPQLTAMLNTLPIEISFIDENNINRYFNESPKVFKRPQMALDREVFACHPPKIEPMVRSILDSFRDGSRNSVPVWMEKEGKPFLVTYMAVRDADNTYLGTVEVVQDMSAAKAHFGGEK